jgi:hypothetical protein
MAVVSRPPGLERRKTESESFGPSDPARAHQRQQASARKSVGATVSKKQVRIRNPKVANPETLSRRPRTEGPRSPNQRLTDRARTHTTTTKPNHAKKARGPDPLINLRRPVETPSTQPRRGWTTDPLLLFFPLLCYKTPSEITVEVTSTITKRGPLPPSRPAS